MNRTNATMTYRPINAEVSAIDIEGELTAFAESELMEAYQQATVREEVRAVILNFSKLEYMTSSGIGLLVTLFIRASRKGKQLYAVGLNPHYQRIFTLTKLNETIPAFDSEEEALDQAQGVWGP